MQKGVSLCTFLYTFLMRNGWFATCQKHSSRVLAKKKALPYHEKRFLMQSGVRNCFLTPV